MVIPSGQPEPAGTYLVTWNGHGDAMALHRILADGSLETANTVTYGTWGQPTIDGSHPNSANGSQPYGDLGFRFLYVGEFDVQWDRELGLDLFYMHARHYSPATGRFIQPDPDRSEANLYAYAANSPVTEIDPDGTCFFVCVLVGAVVDTAVYLATTDSSDWNVGDAAGAVVSGAVESAVNPLAKINKVSKLVNAAQKVYSKFSKAGRATKSLRSTVARLAKPTTKVRAHTDKIWTYKKRLRESPGVDGARSWHLTERYRGRSNAVIHRVKRGKELVHQHVIHVGRHGTRREFPDAWTGIRTVGRGRE